MGSALRLGKEAAGRPTRARRRQQAKCKFKLNRRDGYPCAVGMCRRRRQKSARICWWRIVGSDIARPASRPSASGCESEAGVRVGCGCCHGARHWRAPSWKEGGRGVREDSAIGATAGRRVRSLGGWAWSSLVAVVDGTSAVYARRDSSGCGKEFWFTSGGLCGRLAAAGIGHNPTSLPTAIWPPPGSTRLISQTLPEQDCCHDQVDRRRTCRPS